MALLGDFIDRERERRYQKPSSKQLGEWRRADAQDHAAFDPELRMLACSMSFRL